MEVLSERAKRRSEERKRLKRKREDDAHRMHEEITMAQVERVLSEAEKTLEPVIVPTVELNMTAVGFLRDFFTVSPWYAEDDDDYHSFWRID